MLSLQSCVAAPAACCCRAVPSAVRFFLRQDVPQYENKMPRSLRPKNIMIRIRRASSKRESGKYCGRSFPVPTRRRGCRFSHESAGCPSTRSTLLLSQVMAASPYCTERRVVLWLKVRIIWR